MILMFFRKGTLSLEHSWWGDQNYLLRENLTFYPDVVPANPGLVPGVRHAEPVDPEDGGVVGEGLEAGGSVGGRVEDGGVGVVVNSVPVIWDIVAHYGAVTLE